MINRILIILTRVPYPLIDGASKANFQFILGLTSRGFDVTTISIAPKKEEINLAEFKEKSKITEALFYERPNMDKAKNIKLLLNFLKSPFKPVTYFSYFEKILVQFIKKKIQLKNFDYIIGINPHSIVPLLNEQIPFIYRSENVEHELWQQSIKTTRNPIKKLFFFFQELLVKRLEQKIINKSLLTFTISEEDKKKYLEMCPSKLVETIPMSFNFSAPLPFKEKNHLELFYLGKLDWQPNLDGLIWFLNEIWPSLKKETHQKLKLTIAGSGNSLIIKNLIDQLPNNSNISFLGRIDNVEERYEECDLVIAPIFYGSGTRIKILEASFFGRACVSSQIGFQGSPIIFNQNKPGGLIATTKEDWLNILDNLERKNLKVLGLNAYTQCKEVLDFDVNSMKVKDIILKLHPELNDHHR